jgi:outer membrane protein OmpA-like peptidoglycan-associated protein
MKRFWLIVLCLFSLSLAGETAMAYAAPSKKSAAHIKATKKREAAKRKAEKKRAAKAKEAKKQRIKDGKPLLYVYSYNLKSGDLLPATHITVQEQNAKPTKKPKLSKPTDTKRARVSKGLPPGDYWVAGAKIGYFASDTVWFRHKEDENAINIYLYPETRLTFTVTDSLTSRPVTANVIVRNHEHQKIMQTTSDSIHSLLAVLLDDRIPFYTIEATALNYFPYLDTIVDPTTFTGVRMMPKEVKSFVLRNIYFANGKTRILASSEPALKELYQFLKSRPQQRVRIVGHTDNVGSDRSNQILSEGRCKEVRRVMVERGIAPNRIQILGKGENDPIVPNDTEEHRQMNRRVEIVLL